MKRLRPPNPALRPTLCRMRRSRPNSAIRHPQSTISPRAGATLTEVLMSLLVMGVGVVTVATLFPISILRSVQATQITSATILRINAETQVYLNPQMVFDPDSDGATPADEHDGQVYLVDPLGNAFGLGDVTGTLTTLQRFAGGNFGTTAADKQRNAGALVSLPDSWIPQITDFSDGTETPTQVTLARASLDLSQIAVYEDANGNGVLDSGEDLNGNSVLDTVRSRCVMFDTNAKEIAVRNITNISGQTVSWNTPLPTGFTIGEVRLETQDPRYTYLLTVRNTSRNSGSTPVIGASVDVVVFFNRQFNATYESTPWVLQRSSGNTFTVNGWTSANAPFVKRGGWMLNMVSGRWHRIQQYSEANGTVTLDGTPAGNRFEAIFLPGVVDVYTLKPLLGN